MSSRTLPLLCTAMMLAPVLIWYRQAGDPGIYFSPAAPPGQLLYVLSKLAGMYALLLATLQLLLGFMKGPGLTTVSTLRRRHALIGAGVATSLNIYPGAFHAFDAFAPDAKVSQRLVADRNGALRRAFGIDS